MWKPILTASAALLIVGSSIAVAQPRPGRDGGQRLQPNVEDMRAFGEARLAGLKAGLALKPEQEKFWPAFEAAARDIQNSRIERLTTRPAGAPQRLSPIEMMQRRANALTVQGAAVKKLADAAAPLYDSLDQGQKRRFAVLSHVAGPREFGNRPRPQGGPQRGWNRRDGGFRRTEGEPGSLSVEPIRGEEPLP